MCAVVDLPFKFSLSHTCLIWGRYPEEKPSQIVESIFHPFQMKNIKLATAFIGWTVTTFVAHYLVKRILLAATPGGAEVRKRNHMRPEIFCC